LRLIALIVLFFVQSAWAVTPELPGDQVDNGASSGTWGSCPGGYANAYVNEAGTLATGCSLLLPGNDADFDGYTNDGSLGRAGTTDTDCDDTDKSIFTGVWVSTGTGYKQCLSTGSYGATTLTATTPFCPATGGGVCKYIDFTSGNDSNAGTYASPYKTLGKIAGGSTGAPASPYSLNANDYVIIIGSGTETTTYSNGSTTQTVEFTRPGTLGNEIHIMRYPGSTAKIDCSAGSVTCIEFSAAADYYVLEDLDIKGGTGMIHGGADNVRVTRSWIHDPTALNGNNNNHCIYWNATNNSVIDHSWFKDCLVFTGNEANVGAINWLDNDAAGDGAGHKGNFNVAWLSTKDDTKSDCAFREKHGANAADVGVNGHEIMYNIVWNYQMIAKFDGSGLRLKGNFGYNGNLAWVQNSGESNSHQDEILTYNTVYSGGVDSVFSWDHPMGFDNATTTDKVTMTDNVLFDDSAAYTGGNAEGVLSICGYGSDAQLTQFESQLSLVSNNNCFYNPNIATVFSYFRHASGAGGWGPAGNAGSDYSFANWQSVKSQDSTSFEENPTFDAYYAATSTNCSAKGWLSPVFTSSPPASAASSRKGQKNGSGRKGMK